MHLRILPPPKAVGDRKQDAENGNQGSNLHHGPRRPVERHEILSITELEGHQGIDFHDHGDHRDGGVQAANVEAFFHSVSVLSRARLDVLDFVEITGTG